MFDWMDAEAPEATRDRGTEMRLATYAEEVRIRASLLKRLGYDQDYALHRCMGNIGWAYEMGGTPPLNRAEVKRLVGEIYAR
jgi:hypothetical protein